MLEDRESFAILLADNNNNLIDVVSKISLRKHIKYNRAKLKDDTEYSYVLYTEPQDKQYVFDMTRNKGLKLVWKDETDFYIIDFSSNTKGDIVCYLSDEDTEQDKIEGDIIKPNLKKEFNNVNKVILISSQQLDETQPNIYEHFCFYIRKQEDQ